MDKNLVLISAAVVIKDDKGKLKYFIIKQPKEDKWEVPKILVRKGESSVRAALRTMGEKGGMTTKVLEEVGRAGGVTTVNGKTMPQRYIYYLMLLKNMASEAIGFEEPMWLEYAKASRKIDSKRERSMLKEAGKMYRKWKKMRRKARKAQQLQNKN